MYALCENRFLDIEKSVLSTRIQVISVLISTPKKIQQEKIFESTSRHHPDLLIQAFSSCADFGCTLNHCRALHAGRHPDSGWKGVPAGLPQQALDACVLLGVYNCQSRWHWAGTQQGY
jgi:hypothetical protein